MDLLERRADVITASKNLIELHVLDNFPVFMGCVDQPETDDLVAEMKWCICMESGFLQLRKLIPLDILYQAQHAGSVGKIWAEHHKRFADFIRQYKPLAVFEIGGAHGRLAKEYDTTEKTLWTILEPNPAPIADSRARFVKGFFNAHYEYSGSFDAVAHSHVFEHMYEPSQFMKHLSYFIDEGKYLIFSVPNMRAMLEHKYTNCINFEHTIFLTDDYIEYLLALYGFSVVEKKYFLEDHSIFYATKRDSTVLPVELSASLFGDNKKLYLDYVEYHEKLISELNLKLISTDKPVFLFGAHVFAQYLIAFGLDTSRIVCILDNDSDKQGKRLYGTSMMVDSPEIMRNVVSPVLILKAGVYNDEIKKQISSDVNPNVEYWE